MVQYTNVGTSSPYLFVKLSELVAADLGGVNLPKLVLCSGLGGTGRYYLNIGELV